MLLAKASHPELKTKPPLSDQRLLRNRLTLLIERLSVGRLESRRFAISFLNSIRRFAVQSREYRICRSRAADAAKNINREGRSRECRSRECRSMDYEQTPAT